MATSGGSFIVLDTSVSKIEYGDQTYIDGAGALSVSMWFYPFRTGSVDGMFSKWGGPATTFCFLMESKLNGRIDFLVGDGVSAFKLLKSLTPFPTANQWHFVTSTWVGSTAAMATYIDGVDKTGAKSGSGANTTIQNVTAQVVVGGRNIGGTGTVFDGYLAHAMLHTKALSLSEHNELMLNPNAVPDSRVAYMPLMDTVGADVINNITPTLVGTAASDPLGPELFLYGGQ